MARVERAAGAVQVVDAIGALPPPPASGCELFVRPVGDAGWVVHALGACGTGTPPAWRLDPAGRRTSAIPWELPTVAPVDPSGPIAPVVPREPNEGLYRAGFVTTLTGGALGVAGFWAVGSALGCACEPAKACDPGPWCSSAAERAVGTVGLGALLASPTIAAFGAGMSAAGTRLPGGFAAAALPAWALWPGAALPAWYAGRDGSTAGVLTAIALGVGGYLGSDAISAVALERSARRHGRGAD